MPVGIGPQSKGSKSDLRGTKSPSAPQASYAANLAHSVGIYTKQQPRVTPRDRSGSSTPRQPGEGTRPLSRQARVATPTFTDKERSVIANLDQLTADELRDLNERLYSSRVAKLQELRRAQEDKAQLQVELQSTLTALADSRQASHYANQAVQADRQFVARILKKYKTLVQKFEAQKAEADLSDFNEIDALRKSLAELHAQMDQAKGLSKVLDELENTNADAAQLANLLQYHKIDLSIVQAGSRQALAKAKGHKDSLFQALVALEQHLVTAKKHREQRMSELQTSRESHADLTAKLEGEEGRVLERELLWLQEQITSTRDAKDKFEKGGRDGAGRQEDNADAGGDTPRASNQARGGGGRGPRGPGSAVERSQVEMHLLREQIRELEREITEVKQEVVASPTRSPGGGVRPRPSTAAADGLDRRRTAEERRGKLEEGLSELRAKLYKVENGLESAGADGQASIMAQVAALEAAMESEGKRSKIEAEKAALAEELDWIGDFLDQADKSQAAEGGKVQELGRLLGRQEAVAEAKEMTGRLREARAKLATALEMADTARQDLEEQVEGLGDGERGGAGVAVEALAEKGAALTKALEEAKEQAEHGLRGQAALAQRLESAEQALEAREAELSALRERLEGDEGVEVRDNAVLRQENHALEQDLRSTDASNKVLEQQIRRLQAQLAQGGAGGAGGAGGGEGKAEGVPEPEEEAPPREHAVRKRMQRAGGGGGGAADKADVAEFALIWGLQPTEESYLMWMPEKALAGELPAGWARHVDRRGDVFYHEGGSGFSTYHHPLDTKYKEMVMELKLQLVKRLEAGPATEETLEMERLRLREANAAVERQARELKDQEAELDRRRLQATMDIEQKDDEKVREWESHKEEVLRKELATLRDEEGARAQQARERQYHECKMRDELYKKERQKIREELLEEEKQRLSVERLKLRQRIVKEETAAFRKKLEEEEREKVEAMREEVASGLRASMVSEERQKLAKAEDSVKPHHKAVRDAKDEALELQIQAARAKQASMDEVTRREVAEYAEYLGMSRQDDTHLFWIAEMALTAPLPVGWGEHQDSSGNIFFYNAGTGVSTYEHPMDASFRAYYQKIKAAQL